MLWRWSGARFVFSTVCSLLSYDMYFFSFFLESSVMIDLWIRGCRWIKKKARRGWEERRFVKRRILACGASHDEDGGEASGLGPGAKPVGPWVRIIAGAFHSSSKPPHPLPIH